MNHKHHLPCWLAAVWMAGPVSAAVALPGRIEAENWSRFSDTAASPGTQATSDVGGGLNVGWIQPGEWIEYDTTVAAAGNFRISLRVASAINSAKRIRVLLDDAELTGPIEFTRADGWQAWFEVGFAPAPVSAGSHRVRVVFDTGDLNLNWIQFSPYVPVMPGAPEPVRITNAGTDTATVTWSDKIDDETGFNFYVSTTDTKPASPSFVVPAGTAQKNLTGLPQGTRHHVWVETVNAAGTGAAAMAEFTTLSSAPPAVVPAGAGSYASYPPYDEGNTPGMFQNWALNTPLNVRDNETRPIPTNDWWTHLLFNDSDTSLWSYPQVTKTTPEGFRVYFPHQFNNEGTTIQYGGSVLISADGFSPGRFVAEDWSDWSLDVRAGTADQTIRATVAHGIPFTWFRFGNVQPAISFSATAQFADAAGAPVSFPLTTNCLRVALDGSYFGLHFPAGTTITQVNGVLKPSSHFVVVSALPDANSLAAFHTLALNRPVKTETRWNLDTAQAKLTATWELTTETPDGTPGGNTLQGFLIHHRKAASAMDFSFTNKIYPNTTRGALTLAEGHSFTFTYPWQGIVAHYPKPTDLTGDAPWRPEVMNQIITDYAANANYGTDTYWGGKGLVMLGKYLLFAKETHHPAYAAIKAKLQTALADWLTYTPRETSRYYASYPRWGAMVGFDESYYSYQFTDHHFHYGYLIHAAALMAMDDPEWLRPYAPMLDMVAKEYANWDRTDTRFPFLRTFDPWMGHSYAGGTGSPGGNNQESTSEALQSWASLFFLGNALGNDSMRNAGAFGYHQESQATMEYWFNRSGDNWPAAYKATHDVVGILWNDGFAYGTFFSAAPQHIYGIQWLPVMPAFRHVVEGVDRAWSDHLYQGLKDRILSFYQNENDPIAADGVVTLQEIGQDWGNALLGYRLFSAPDEVAATLESYRTSTVAAEKATLFSPEGGLNYYYSHAHKTFGDIAWDRRLSLPASTAFKDPTTGAYTYVAYNPGATQTVCEVRNDSGVLLGGFRVPAGQTVAHKLDSALARIEVTAPKKHLVLNESMQFTVTGYDQYGASFDLTDARITATPGGVMTPAGKFTALARTDHVTVSASQDGFTGTFVLRIGDAPKLASLTISPPFARVEVNGGKTFSCTGKDQYGDPFPLENPVWTATRGTIAADGIYQAPASPGTAEISVDAGGLSTKARVVVSPVAANLALGKPVQSSGVAAGNLASRAVDGNTSSRWESTQGVDPQWFRVDLDDLYDLRNVDIDWETAAAKQYLIEVSTDGTNWTTIHTRTDAPAGARRQDSIACDGTSARHIRLTGEKRTTQYGYSIWEFKVFGYPHVSRTTPTSLFIAPPHLECQPGASAKLTAYAMNDAGEGGEVSPSWGTTGGSIDPSGILTSAATPGMSQVSASYGGLSASSMVTVMPAADLTAFHNWLAARLSPGQLANPLIADPTADPDGDGRANFAEFYLSCDPLVADADRAMEIDLQTGLSLTRNPAAAAEVSLRFESSNNLSQWSLWSPEDMDTSGPDTIRIPLQAISGPKFFRARLSLP